MERPGFVGFIRCVLDHAGASWVLFGSFGVVGFTWVRPWGRRVHSWWLGSLVCPLLVDGFIRGGWVQLGAPRGSSGSLRSLCSRGWGLEVVWFIRGRWIHSGAPRGSSVSFGVAGFTQVRPGGREVHSGSFGSLGYALVVVEFIQGTP